MPFWSVGYSIRLRWKFMYPKLFDSLPSVVVFLKSLRKWDSWCWLSISVWTFYSRTASRKNPGKTSLQSSEYKRIIVGCNWAESRNVSWLSYTEVQKTRCVVVKLCVFTQFWLRYSITKVSCRFIFWARNNMSVSFTNTSTDDMALIEPFLSPEFSCFFSK